MKNYLKKTKQVATLLTTLLLVSCGEDLYENQEHESEHNHIVSKIVTGEEKESVIEKLKQIFPLQLKVQTSNSNERLSTKFGTIDYSKIIAIESENGAINYSFGITDKNQADKTFKNLILKVQDQFEGLKVATYTMSDEFAIKYKTGKASISEFKGSLQLQNVLNSSPCDPDNSNTPIGGGGSGGTGSNIGGSGYNSGGVYYIGGGSSGGSGGGSGLSMTCTNCARSYSSIKEWQSSECAAYDVTINIVLKTAKPKVTQSNPCDDNAPIALIEIDQNIRRFFKELTKSQQIFLTKNSQVNNWAYQFLQDNIDEFTGLYSTESVDKVVSLIDYLLQNSNLTFDYVMDNKTSFNDHGEIDNYTIGNYDNTVYSDFNPFQNWSNISSVIPLNKFVGWNSRAHPTWQCMEYSKEQLRVVGYQISNYYATGQTFQIYTSQNGVNTSQLSQGLSYLKHALSNGIPVVVGVDDAPGHPGNLDSTTDHFIVIVGMGHNSNGNYFQFYDNASASASQGASPLNLLYYNSTTGIISGSSQTSYGQGQPYPYILTMIRKSKLL